MAQERLTRIPAESPHRPRSCEPEEVRGIRALAEELRRVVHQRERHQRHQILVRINQELSN